ncbi:hypothetical protein OX284_012090 [Flavobacterium sp. SUN046]|uniref:hypothetical protein n=1 Tax=Flavobacterium sp. SUN046 TaxID=3002440 RepID=UPI002DBB22CD|nr:hypothetical protein [Flavobacterium sp. SUN046]MEC4050175.1 hypothetical protein [Flavobacterium sp. SUN046]
MKKIFLILILFFFYSCSNLKEQIVNDNYTYSNKLFNKRMGIYIEYFGDMFFIDINKSNQQHLKQIILDTKIIDSKTSIVSYLKTNSEPFYETVLLFTNKTDSLPNGLVLNNTKKHFVVLKKSIKNSSFYLLMKAMNPNNSDINNTLIQDGEKIINSLSFDNKQLEQTTFFDIFNGVRELDNYLVAIDKLKNAPLILNPQQKFNQFQFLVTINSFISNNKEYDSLLHKKMLSIKNIYQQKVDDFLLTNLKYKDTSALERFKSIIESQQVVMLNENHWFPKHRIFATQLLDQLKASGFKYLAIEAIEPLKDSILNLRNFPSKDSGYYTREPYFAHFIRKAKKLGFQIIPYDDMSGATDREFAQASNLKKILQADPNAKIFVYAGLSHVFEQDPNTKRMAQWFNEITGINPVTFDQSKVFADTPNEIEIIPADKLFKDNNKVVDYFIINNITPSLKQVYHKEEYGKIQLQNLLKRTVKNKCFLIKIFDKEEFDKIKFNAIPISIFYYYLNQPIRTIDFPKGNYYINISTLNNDNLYTGTILVD